MKEELTKGDVYVVVDTPKKAKKLKKLLDIFSEPIYNTPNHKNSGHNGSDYGWFYGFSNNKWQGFNTKSIAHNGKEFKKISIKELRNILAKEHLISGDYIVATIDKIKYLVEFDRVCKIGFIIGKKYLPFSEFGRNVEPYGRGGFDYFDRYATPEEIALLEPKPKDLEVGKWYRLIGHTVEYKPLMLITSISGSTVKFCGFNFIGNWVDNDFYTLEELKRQGYTEATSQEVESALIKEAKRRGLLDNGIRFKSPSGTDYGYYYNNGKVSYNIYLNILEFNYIDEVIGCCKIHLFNNGKWAEVIDKFAELKEAHKNGVVIQYYSEAANEWVDSVYNNPVWSEFIKYRIKPEQPVKVGDWMFNPNSKKITQVKKDNHGKSLLGSGWVKIKDTELVEKLNSL